MISKELADERRYPLLSKLKHERAPPCVRIEWPGGFNYQQIFRRILCPGDSQEDCMEKMLRDVEAVIGGDQQPEGGSITQTRLMGGIKSFSDSPDLDAVTVLWLREPQFVKVTDGVTYAICECTLRYWPESVI